MQRKKKKINTEARNKLRQWLKDQKYKRIKFTEEIGIGINTLTNILSGNYTPGLHLAIRMEIATNGAVKCMDWMEKEPEKGVENEPPKM